jgi:hypothetical protein
VVGFLYFNVKKVYTIVYLFFDCEFDVIVSAIEFLVGFMYVRVGFVLYYQYVIHIPEISENVVEG